MYETDEFVLLSPPTLRLDGTIDVLQAEDGGGAQSPVESTSQRGLGGYMFGSRNVTLSIRCCVR